ncbi:hypothetical protein FBU30_001138 [Linnemannia zychae]|nr:hypothetical protein FBU30_001138 [Linnemannia zychae]
MIATILAIAALAAACDALWCGCKNNWLESRTNSYAARACTDAGLTWHSGTFGGCDVGNIETDPYLGTYKQKCIAIDNRPVFKALNQTTEWNKEGIDYIALFKEYQRTVTDEMFTSFANDLIADLTPLSSKADSFPRFINLKNGLKALKAARKGREITRTISSE